MGHTTMAPRRAPLALACLWALAIVAHPGAALAQPTLRVPQVHVNGSGLQAYFDSVGENINVQTDQQDAQLLRPSLSNSSTFTLQIEFTGPPGNTVGLYNGHALPGTLMPMFPTAATNGWFVVASWRTAPVRVIIFLFDANAAFLGSTTFLGADRNAIGFYLATPHATYFTQDPLNPGGGPRALFYAGTGINTGSWWLTWENGDAPADFDFDDCVLLIESTDESGNRAVPVHRATWGALKSRFR